MTARLFRPEPTHAAELARVHMVTWQAAYAGLLPHAVLHALTPAWRLPMWNRVIERHPERALAAALDDELIGFSLFGPERDAPSERAELHALYVHPSHWGTGVGRDLWLATLDAMKPRFREVVLWVVQGNDRAIRFYERAGFAWDGTTETVDVLEGHPLPELQYRLALG